MTITLELPPDVEAKLRESLDKHDADAVQRVIETEAAHIADAVMQTYDLYQQPKRLTVEEFEEITEELLAIAPSLPSLPDSAITREAIYDNHP